jgi:hypothetical protein
MIECENSGLVDEWMVAMMGKQREKGSVYIPLWPDQKRLAHVLDLL